MSAKSFVKPLLWSITVILFQLFAVIGHSAPLTEMGQKFTFSGKKFGETYDLSYENQPAEQVVHFDGELNFTSWMAPVDMLSHYLVPGKSIRLVINKSNGGLISHYNDFAEVLREACPLGSKNCRITTELRAACASSCVLLFLNGDVRRAVATSILSFHSEWIIYKSFKLPFFSDHLIALGVPEKWLKAHPEIYSKQEGYGMVATDPRFVGSNIITELIKP